MRIPSILAGAAFALVSPLAYGAVNFFEGFENPLIPGPDPYLAIPTGTQSLDNTGWVVINSADPNFGVYVTTLPDLSVGTGQALALGGGQTSGSSLSIVVSGFTAMQLPTIKFDHRADFGEEQRTTVTVTDPNNGNAVIYTKEATGDGTVNENFNASPTGDTVVVTISQSGSTLNSDGAIDNLEITAIPEPSLALLSVLSIFIGLTRRRR